MNHLIDDYVAYVNEVQQRLTKGQSYFHQFSDETEITEEIEKEEAEIRALIESLREKERMKTFIKNTRENLITDHYLFPTLKIGEIQPEREQDRKWEEYLKPNHEIRITIKINELTPFLQFIDINQNRINFDEIRFHLYHADQSHISSLVKYHPKYNLHRQGDVIEGKMLKNDRSVLLEVKHQIRPHNLELYQGLFKEMPIKIVAEAAYGLILGIADIHLDLFAQKNKPIRDEYRCIIFNHTQFQQNGEVHSKEKVLMAKTRITIDANPISPLLQDLKKNAQVQMKKRKASKSKSPNRLISQSPSKMHSPKIKRQLLTQISAPFHQTKYLTVYEAVEYRYKLGSILPKREIVYRQNKGIKERKIELVKIEENYYLKCFLSRDEGTGRAYSHFELNQQKIIIYVVPDKLFRIIDYQTYFKAKDKKTTLSNKLVRISNQTLIYPHQTTRVIKNLIKQSTIDGILSSIFLKTPFEGCQICVQSPFIIEDITHKEGGYMIGYYHSSSDPISQELQTSLVFFLKSNFKRINQIHVFECTVKPRTAGRDTIYKELIINPKEDFHKISLDLMANENVQYQMRSTSAFFHIVNGQNYQYSAGNQDLIAQLIPPFPVRAYVDVIFTDSKLRCFFMRVSVMVDQEVDPQEHQ